MKATARFQTPWRPPAQAQSSSEPEVSAEQVEAAMRTVAIEAARRDNRTPLATADLLTRPRLSPDHAIIANPIGAALGYMEITLATHLVRIAGPERAAAARKRIDDELFETFDRPAIDAAGPRQ